MAGEYFQGALMQSNAEWQADSQAKGRKIDELRELLAGERKANARWANHYVALEAKCEYLLQLLDEAHGQDKNPARQPAYSAEDDKNHRIPVGPRAGQCVTRMDHIYLDKFIQIFRKHYTAMTTGDWKSWITGDIFE